MSMVLIYHDVAPTADFEAVGFPGSLAARYKLTPERFETHLDAIEATGRGVALVDSGNSSDQAAITFDDGGSSAIRAAEALERRGWRGHFFIVTSRIGTPGFLEPDQILDLVRRGHAVGSHSHTHPTYMGKLSKAEIEEEWLRSRDVLGDLLPGPPATASVPGGFLTTEVIASAADAGYRVLFTSEPRTRRQEHDGMSVVGRFTVWSTTSPARITGYVKGSALARGQLWVEWKTKRAVKGLAPGAYQALRRIRARLG